MSTKTETTATCPHGCGSCKRHEKRRDHENDRKRGRQRWKKKWQRRFRWLFRLAFAGVALYSIPQTHDQIAQPLSAGIDIVQQVHQPGENAK